MLIKRSWSWSVRLSRISWLLNDSFRFNLRTYKFWLFLLYLCFCLWLKPLWAMRPYLVFFFLYKFSPEFSQRHICWAILQSCIVLISFQFSWGYSWDWLRLKVFCVKNQKRFICIFRQVVCKALIWDRKLRAFWIYFFRSSKLIPHFHFLMLLLEYFMMRRSSLELLIHFMKLSFKRSLVS